MTINIKETFASFTGEIEVGKYSFFIVFDKQNNVNIEINKLVEQAKHFHRVVLIGDSFEQKTEVASLIKKLVKENNKIDIEINTKGLIKPVSIGTLENITYNVELQLKRSGIKTNDRLKDNVIEWFVDIGANFKFEVINTNDVDEVLTISNMYNIKKSKIYLVPKFLEQKDVEFFIERAKHLGFNIAPKFHLLWEKDGRI